MEGEEELGRSEAVLWVVGSPLSIQALSWMGQNGAGHEDRRTQRDKGGGHWTLGALGMAILTLGCSPGHPMDGSFHGGCGPLEQDQAGCAEMIPPRPGWDQKQLLGWCWV